MDPPMLRLPATASPPSTPVRATKKYRTDENHPNHNDAAAAGHGAKVATSVLPSPSKSGDILASPIQPGKLVNRRQAKKESNLDQQYAAALMKKNDAEMKHNEAEAEFDEAKAALEEEKKRGINPEFTLCNPKYEVAGDFFGNGDKFATGSTGTTESKKITKLLPPGTITQYQVSHLTAVQCERKNYHLGYGGYEGNYSGTIRGELGFIDGKCVASSKVSKDKMKMLVEERKGWAKNFNNYAAEVPFQAYYGGDDNGVRLVKPDASSPSGWSHVDEQEFINKPTAAKAFEVKNRKCLDLLGKALKVSEKKRKDGRKPVSAGIVLAGRLKPSFKTSTGEHVICFDMERFHGNKTYKTLGNNHSLQLVAGYRFIITSKKKFTPDKIVSEVQGNTAEDDSKPTATAV